MKSFLHIDNLCFKAMIGGASDILLLLPSVVFVTQCHFNRRHFFTNRVELN